MNSSKFDDTDRTAFHKALMREFMSLDRMVKSYKGDGSRATLHEVGVEELLRRFFGQLGDGVDTGYIFTLNQDLLIERKFINHHLTPGMNPAIPGIRGSHFSPPFSSTFGGITGDDSEIFASIDFDPASPPPLAGNFNYIKLHGSFNWKSSDGRELMVIGTEKSRQIMKSPLLTWYSDVFKEVLGQGDVRVMLFGYSFSDLHINEVIADAVNNHGLKFYVWNTTPFVDLLSRCDDAHKETL